MPDVKAKVPVKKGDKAWPMLLDEAWQPFARLREEMDRLFDDFFDRVPNLPFRGRGEIEPMRGLGRVFGAAAPAVDLVEKDGAYELTAELPGLDEKDVAVTLSDEVLTIKGEKKEEREEQAGGFHVSERRYGAFHRSFRVPGDVAQEKIEASFKKGVLTVTLPKNPEAAKKEKTIKIKGG
jgi:HSP20 family protein